MLTGYGSELERKLQDAIHAYETEDGFEVIDIKMQATSAVFPSDQGAGIEKEVTLLLIMAKDSE